MQGRDAAMRILLIAVATNFWGCTSKVTSPENVSPSAEAKPDPRQLISKGRGIYVSSCTACHNTDPTKDGGLGPAIRGSSRELLEARILRASYPEGYTPKRPTKAMPAMPYLNGDIDALHSYLNSP